MITGGAGFIGSHAIRHFVTNFPEYHIVNFDALTYAGNLENLSDIDTAPNYTFFQGDITNVDDIARCFDKYEISDIIHFAAESHVDRSITDPIAFLKTNILGTASLLIKAKESWANNYDDHIFYHVSTDEVYGSLGETGLFEETTAYDPKSPYSASKASSDHLVRAFNNTYGLQTKISNCSNNYGPHQFPEKLIPLVINNIKKNKTIPVYGDGSNVRDWLHVTDHVKAIETVFHKGQPNETYNIGGKNEIKNLDLVQMLCDIADELLDRRIGDARKLITFVKDRAGHDHRYAIDSSKIEKDLNWFPEYTVEGGLKQTVQWYLNNEGWLDNVASGSYQKYYEEQYASR